MEGFARERERPQGTGPRVGARSQEGKWPEPRPPQQGGTLVARAGGAGELDGGPRGSLAPGVARLRRANLFYIW